MPAHADPPNNNNETPPKPSPPPDNEAQSLPAPHDTNANVITMCPSTNNAATIEETTRDPSNSHSAIDALSAVAAAEVDASAESNPALPWVK